MNIGKPGQVITISANGTNQQLQRAIEAAVPAAVMQTKELSKKFKGLTDRQTALNIFNFLKTQIQYKADGNHQKVKLPSALLRTRVGDCKSYALFTAAILTNLKIPYRFTYASYTTGNKEPEHIYVTTDSGFIIDAVWHKFNSEKRAAHKFNRKINGVFNPLMKL
jgi:hypothetical protein